MLRLLYIALFVAVRDINCLYHRETLRVCSWLMNNNEDNSTSVTIGLLGRHILTADWWLFIMYQLMISMLFTREQSVDWCADSAVV